MSKLLLLFFLVSIIFSFSCSKKKPAKTIANQATDSILIPVDTIPRSSITFILGIDKHSRNPYYSLANQYYRLNDSDKTEIVVNNLFSLLEVRDYLEKFPPKNGRPWGLINLVSHGNEFIDLSVSVFPNGPRTSSESLIQAINDTLFKPLDSSIVDAKTFIYLHGCAVGQNMELLKTLGIAFGGNTKPIKVKASRLFEYYGYQSGTHNPQFIRRYFAQVWYGFYKVDSLPNEDVLINQFQNRYPTENVNWQEALRRQFPTNPSEIYHTSFGVPVIWEDFYEKKEDRPILNSKTKQMQWLAGKPEFLKLIQKTNIPYKYFQFKYYAMEYKNDEGNFYSIKAKARAGVICLIQPLLSDIDSLKVRFEPFNPLKEDTLYFGVSQN